MIYIKSGVKLEKDGVRIHDKTVKALIGVSNVFLKHGYDTTITSCLDGVHSVNSLHYKGKAMDFRTRHLPDLTLKRVVRDDIAAELGGEFDVVLESTHIHVEYDPD